MSTALIFADWFPLGQHYFRKIEIFPMEWHQDIKLENFIIASASYGGPLAIRRDDRKLVKVTAPNQSSVVSIFSGSGRSITSFPWKQRPIVHMGWSNDEKLIIIQDDGNVVIYDMFGRLIHKFNIFPKVHDTKIVSAKIFTNPKNITGVAVMNANYEVFVVNSIKDIKTRPLSEVPKSSSHPTCWEIVSEESSTDVLLAREKELYRLKQDERHTNAMLKPDITVSYTLILEMSVSLSARYLCFFTDSGFLWLGSTDLRHRFCEIDTNTIHKPKQLMWCGNETVVVYWEHDHKVLVVGKDGNTKDYYYDSSIHLVAEIDGVRIISNSTHELLQKVPEVVQKVFRINSTEPGSFLLEASKQFQKGSHKANEYISLVSNLEDAVHQCLDAAGYEFNRDIQKMLIRAAQFGKCFVPGISSDKYVYMCRLLRVLNAIRDPNVGIPLTINQLQYMKFKESDEYEPLKNLLDRLIIRNMYFLALQIAKYLKMPEEVGSSYILVHWAKYKVGQDLKEEETVAREIFQKLGYSSGVSYREIAEKASEYGKNKLAIKLLDHESKASEQVELLLKLHENKSALLKAIESGDTDLVYMVIRKLRENMSLGDFKMTIRNFPVAQALYIKYCKEFSRSALNEMYIQEDDFASQAELSIEECLALDETRSHLIDSYLTTAIEAYKKGRRDLNASLVEDNLKLLRLQRDLEEKLQIRKELVGKSVHDTCEFLLIIKEYKWAEKVRNDFKIPEKRFWILKINSLASQKDWIELDKFSKSKKPPCGFAPFVDACLDMNNLEEAKKYMPRVSEDVKVKFYIKAGLLDEAADIAFQQRDIQGLMAILGRASALPDLKQRVASMVNQLEFKK